MSKFAPTQADHVVEYQLGGSKRVSLRVIDSNRIRWMPKDGIPASRAECPDTSKELCVFVHCRSHLLRLDGGADGDRAGRPSLSRLPRDSSGLTVRLKGDLGDERAPTTLEPRWLDADGEFQHVESCSLNAIARNNNQPMDNRQVGALIGRHRTMVGKFVEKTLRRMQEQGVASEDIARVMDPGASAERTREPSRAVRRRA